MLKQTSKFKNSTINTTGYENWYYQISLTDEEATYGSFLSASSQFVAYCSQNNEISVTDLKFNEKYENLGLNPKTSSNANFKVKNPTSVLFHDARNPIRGINFHFRETYEQPEYSVEETEKSVKEYKQPTSTASLCSFSSDKVIIQNISGKGENIKTDEIFNFDCKDCFDVQFNRSCYELISIADENNIHLCDLTKNTAFQSVEVGDESVSSFAWLEKSKSLAASNQKCDLFLVDCVSNKVSHSINQSYSGNGVVQSFSEGDRLFTIGFEKNRKRNLKIWDLKKFQKPISTFTIDSNPGKVFANFDPEAKLMHIVGRGETALSIVDLSFPKPPFFREVAKKIMSRKPSLSSCLVPKSALDIYGCEVNRILTISKESIEVVRIEVPRRRKNMFFPELFPDMISPIDGEMGLDEWQEKGEEEHDVAFESVLKMYKLKNGILAMENVEKKAKFQRKSQIAEKKERELEDLRGREHLKDQRRYKKAAKTIGYIPKYKNITLKEPKKEETTFGLQVGEQCFDCNELFFAVNAQYGNDIYVNSVNFKGKVEHPPLAKNLLSGHKTKVNVLKFDKFDPQKLVSGGTDGCIKVWSNLLEANDVVWEVIGHNNTLNCLLFHPSVDGLLLSNSNHQDLRMWNIRDKTDSVLSEDSENLLSSVGANDICFDYSGLNVIFLSKENVLNACPLEGKNDSISLKVKHKLASGLSTGAPAVLSVLSEENLILVSGFSKGGRQVRVFKLGNDLTFLQSLNVPNGASVCIPHPIHESSSFLLTSKGEALIRTFEVRLLKEKAEFHKCSELKTKTLSTIFSVKLPFRCNEVENFEVAKVAQLSKNKMQVLSFIFPRSAEMKAYFADDLYANNATLSGEPKFKLADFLKVLKSSSSAKINKLKPNLIQTLNTKKAPLFSVANEKRQLNRKSNILHTRTRLVQQQQSEIARKEKEKSKMLTNLTKFAARNREYTDARAKDNLNLSDDDDWSD